MCCVVAILNFLSHPAALLVHTVTNMPHKSTYLLFLLCCSYVAIILVYRHLSGIDSSSENVNHAQSVASGAVMVRRS